MHTEMEFNLKEGLVLYDGNIGNFKKELEEVKNRLARSEGQAEEDARTDKQREKSENEPRKK